MNRPRPPTAQAIAKARNAVNLSQKELTVRVMKEEVGGSIFPQ